MNPRARRTGGLKQGQLAFKSKSSELTAAQRAAFIMFDGRRSSEEVLKSMAWMGLEKGDLDHLVASGMLIVDASSREQVQEQKVQDKKVADGAEPSGNAEGKLTLSAQEHYAKAYPIATRLTSGLGLRGFRLNLSVERASGVDQLRALGPKIRDAVGAEPKR